MASTKGSLQFRGVGGEYRIVVQAPDVFAAADDWLRTTIVTANLVAARVWEGWVPETETIAEGTLFITYNWKRNNAPDKYTHGVGGAGGRVSDLIYEILVWVQGKSYTPCKATAAALVPLLDVGQTATTGGYILGAELYGPARGFYNGEGG